MCVTDVLPHCVIFFPLTYISPILQSLPRKSLLARISVSKIWQSQLHKHNTRVLGPAPWKSCEVAKKKVFIDHFLHHFPFSIKYSLTYLFSENKNLVHSSVQRYIEHRQQKQKRWMGQHQVKVCICTAKKTISSKETLCGIEDIFKPCIW